MILHIVLPEDWAAARAGGGYPTSTRGATIAQVGYLHASEDAGQVGMVGGFVYPDRPDAFVVEMDEAALADVGMEVRREPGDPDDPASPLFPHVYLAGRDEPSVPVELMRPVPHPDTGAPLTWAEFAARG